MKPHIVPFARVGDPSTWNPPRLWAVYWGHRVVAIRRDVRQAWTAFLVRHYKL